MAYPKPRLPAPRKREGTLARCPQCAWAIRTQDVEAVIARHLKGAHPERPTRYYVEYEDAELIARERARAIKAGDGDNVEHGNMIAMEDFEDLETARTFMRVQYEDHRYACIRERQHLVDETPAGYPEWSMYDSDDIVIED